MKNDRECNVRTTALGRPGRRTLMPLAGACAALTLAQAAQATPSTTFYTPATTYVQPFLVPHITYDTYFNGKGAYPIDTGLTMGILPFEKLQAEVGIDAMWPYKGFYMEPSGPLFLNAKLGLPENAFGAWFPGISAGVQGVGFTKGTAFHMLHGEISKTIPVGTLVAGGYYGAGGDDALWTSSDGAVHRAGVMGAFVTPDIVLDLTGLKKINFFADVMTGKNAFGGGGPGIGLYFTPAIDVLTGPVFFFDKALQPPVPPGGEGSSMMWTVQLDVDIDFAPAPATPTPTPPTPPAAPPAAPTGATGM
jgi:hypothetical protein